jgi:hypothetical protein
LLLDCILLLRFKPYVWESSVDNFLFILSYTANLLGFWIKKSVGNLSCLGKFSTSCTTYCEACFPLEQKKKKKKKPIFLSYNFFFNFYLYLYFYFINYFFYILVFLFSFSSFFFFLSAFSLSHFHFSFFFFLCHIKSIIT